MFDTIDGLPVHALVLHATVGLLSVMAIVTFITAVVPKLRRGVSVGVAVVDALCVPLVWVTQESGEKLQQRLSAQAGSTIAEDHGEKGGLLIYFAIALMVAGLIVALFARSGGLSAVFAIVASLAIGGAVIGWTFVVGDSGARAVWEDTIASTEGG